VQVRATQRDGFIDPGTVTLPSGERVPAPRTGRSAALVALGIFCSRIAGLVRQRVFAHYFGLQSDAADAFMAAFRIPNFLQNLFGEGALSASFIPVYATLLARGEREEASRVAGAVAALLALVTAILVLAGVLTTPLLIAAIAPGFVGAKRDLTISLVRILFPGAGLLVLSAWCLGILNSHHRFLLSYTAPVLWNLAMIATLVAFGAQTPLPRLAWMLAWGSVVGSALQFGAQVPTVRRLAPDIRWVLDRTSDNVRTVVRNFLPVFVSRGVVQISAYIDALLASLLPTGAVTGLANAQLLYTLPVSLFGMSVSAAELPAMSGAVALAAGDTLRARLDAGLRQIAFFVVPSAVAFLVLGDIVAAAVLQTGRFTHEDSVYVWGILAGSAVGLLASTLGRLYSSTYFALRDTRTPLRYAAVRVALTTVLGYVCAIVVPPLVGISPRWGTAGLTVSAGVSGWVEFALLRRTLNRRLGPTGLPATLLVRLWGSALAAAALAWVIKLSLPDAHPLIMATLVLGPYGGTFLGASLLFRVPEARTALARVRRRLRSR
jgi:putative peptidoglycan lipid II flippase